MFTKCYYVLFGCYLSVQRKWAAWRKDQKISFIINWETFFCLILWRGKTGHFTIHRDDIVIISYYIPIHPYPPHTPYTFTCTHRLFLLFRFAFVQLWSKLWSQKPDEKKKHTHTPKMETTSIVIKAKWNKVGEQCENQHFGDARVLRNSGNLLHIPLEFWWAQKGQNGTHCFYNVQMRNQLKTICTFSLAK